MAQGKQGKWVHDVLYIRTDSNRDLVGSRESERLIREIVRDRGWLLTLGAMSEKVKLESESRAAVGIIEITGGEEELEGLALSDTLDRAEVWIALIPPNGLDSLSIRDFVGRNCFDYHTWPVEPKCLVPIMGHAHGMAQLRRGMVHEASRLAQVDEDGSGTSQLVGKSPSMQKLRALITRVAKSAAPVMISGETGTGKELVARAIHGSSLRRDGPLVTVDCGVIPQDLIYSELFGHERGAFTGARDRRIGQVERANGGTLFLDEIGELPLSQQAHLLRVLQERRVQRLGSGQVHSVDIRVLAASHVDLAVAVREGKFREDLYYRLNVVPLQIPPLRERPRDIEMLAEFFLAWARENYGGTVREIARDAYSAMRDHDWPGNVRELQNRVQRATIMTEGVAIHAADLGLEPRSASRPLSLMEARARAEVDAIREALVWAGDSRTLAARVLGTSRVTLYRLMERHGIQGHHQSMSKGVY